MSAQPGQKGVGLPMPKGRAHAQALALARASAQARHLGVDLSLIQEHQPVRLLAHARLTLIRPDPTLVPHVGARTPPPSGVFYT
jgi:hypothetical protein